MTSDIFSGWGYMLDAKVWYFSLGGGASPSDDVWGVQGRCCISNISECPSPPGVRVTIVLL